MNRIMKHRVTFKVSFDLPDGASVALARDYLNEAVATWHGSLRPPGGYHENDPGDPFFLFDRHSIKITQVS
jgi:hypothetical protein